MELHPSEYDMDWIIKNLNEIKLAIDNNNIEYAIGKIDGINGHLQRTKAIIQKK
jgi:hypothetical protein